MEGIGKGLGGFFVFCAIACLLIGGCVTWVGRFVAAGNDSIRSRVRIVPTWELEASGQQVDTIWVYSPESD